MYGVLSISNTAAVIAECWNEAEHALQRQVQKYSPGLDEEGITVTFHAKLAESLFAASDRKEIEKAFTRDFELSFWNENLDIDPDQIARGLKATVTLHKRNTEKLTGGDFGLVILRPQIHYRHSSIHITQYARGLLTQAKLKRSQGWPSFTRNQENVLPDRFEYLALLLYCYSDVARCDLEPFAWQMARGMSLASLKKMLREDRFADTLTSSDIVKQLSLAKIGTENAALIDQFVSPISNRSLVIEINWPPGDHPGSRIQVHSKHHATNVQKLLIQQ
jgi:hypothetical protein